MSNCRDHYCKKLSSLELELKETKVRLAQV